MFQAFPTIFCRLDVLPMRGTNTSVPERASDGIVFAKSGDEIFVPSCGQLNGLFGYRTDRCSEENVHAVIAPGARSTPPTAAVKSFTYTLAAKPAERCFVDLSRPKSVKSTGEKEYMMIVRDYVSGFTRVFFLRTKDETAMYFSKYLAEIAP